MTGIPDPNTIREEFQNICTCVGLVAVPFAQLEATLDMAIVPLFQEMGGKKIAKKLPVVQAERTKFVTDCLDRIEALAPFKSVGQALMTAINREAIIRNDIVHGFV